MAELAKAAISCNEIIANNKAPRGMILSTKEAGKNIQKEVATMNILFEKLR